MPRATHLRSSRVEGRRTLFADYSLADAVVIKMQEENLLMTEALRRLGYNTEQRNIQKVFRHSLGATARRFIAELNAKQKEFRKRKLEIPPVETLSRHSQK